MMNVIYKYEEPKSVVLEDKKIHYLSWKYFDFWKGEMTTHHRAKTFDNEAVWEKTIVKSMFAKTQFEHNIETNEFKILGIDNSKHLYVLKMD